MKIYNVTLKRLKEIVKKIEGTGKDNQRTAFLCRDKKEEIFLRINN